MSDLIVLSPDSDGFSPIAFQRLVERFPNGIEASLPILESQLRRLKDSSISLLEPLVVSMGFDGQRQIRVGFDVALRTDCMRCMKPVDRRLALSADVLLFDTAEQADRAMMSDPEVDAVSTEDQRDFTELIEDEILLEIGHGLTHSDCQPTLKDESGRPNPFQDLAQLLSMKKPS
jgi:uncharacterized metal-binding protein YceD (DUF177 family)